MTSPDLIGGIYLYYYFLIRLRRAGEGGLPRARIHYKRCSVWILVPGHWVRDGKEIQDHDEGVRLGGLHTSQFEGRAKEHGDEVKAEGGQGAKWVAQGSTPLYPVLIRPGPLWRSTRSFPRRNLVPRCRDL